MKSTSQQAAPRWSTLVERPAFLPAAAAVLVTAASALILLDAPVLVRTALLAPTLAGVAGSAASQLLLTSGGHSAQHTLKDAAEDQDATARPLAVVVLSVLALLTAPLLVALTNWDLTTNSLVIAVAAIALVLAAGAGWAQQHRVSASGAQQRGTRSWRRLISTAVSAAAIVVVLTSAIAAAQALQVAPAERYNLVTLTDAIPAVRPGAPVTLRLRLRSLGQPLPSTEPTVTVTVGERVQSRVKVTWGPIGAVSDGTGHDERAGQLQLPAPTSAGRYAVRVDIDDHSGRGPLALTWSVVVSS